MELKERVKLSLLTHGNGLVENFKNNSLYLYEKYQGSDELVQAISNDKLVKGGFYFIHYQDDSNWMKYSPIFIADYKVFNELHIIYAINFNFIPLEFRVQIFDNFISKTQFETNAYLEVDFKGVYTELIRYGFEYALMEFNVSQVALAHKIHLDILPRFLNAQHPINKYDPEKLMQIWTAKLTSRQQRHQEIITSMVSDFYDVNNEISDKYNVLKDHIKRVQKSYNRYGR